MARDMTTPQHPHGHLRSFGRIKARPIKPRQAALLDTLLPKIAFDPAEPLVGETWLEISQEEVGLLSGISRQAANEALKTLEARGVIKLERMGIAVKDVAALRQQRD